MNFHRMLYTLYDFCNHKKLSRCVNKLEAAYQSGRPGEIDSILKYAVNNVPAYQALKLKELRLESFPVTQKEIIKNAAEDFLSTQYSKDSLIAGRTSGSSGAPFRFYWDKDKALSRTAEVIYHNSWLGYRVGDLHLLNAVGGRKGKIKAMLQNEILENPCNISDEWLARQRTLLIDKKIPYYVAYGSVLDRLSQFCADQGDNPKIYALKGVISTAEHLSEEASARAESVFGCTVLCRYAMLETGLLAHQCPEEKQYHVNVGNYHIEFLKQDSDTPAQPGEVSRVVVTDLNAMAMPLIRYDTGDLAVVDNTPCRCGKKGPIIKQLMGRRIDNLINESGKTVSWFSINHAMRTFESFKKYQLIQHRLDLCDVNVIADNHSEEKAIKNAVHSLLGHSVDVRVHFVDSIEPLSSGKAPYVINKILPSKSSQHQPTSRENALADTA